MLLLNLRDSLPLLTQQPIEIAMTFTFTQQIESTQNEIAQLQAKLETYSKTDDYLTQSEELLHQVTNAGFKEKDLQIVRSHLQDIWLIESNYDTTAEIEWRDVKLDELREKIKSLEANLEMALEQRDRSNEKYNKLLRKQIFEEQETEFLNQLESPAGQFAHQDSDIETVEVNPTPSLPLSKRIKEFIRIFKEGQTSWGEVRNFAEKDPKFIPQLLLAKTRKKDIIKKQLPLLLADWIENKNRDDRTWVDKETWELAEKELAHRRSLKSSEAKNTPVLTVKDAHRKGMQREQEINNFAQRLITLSVSKAKEEAEVFFNRNLGAIDSVADLLISKLEELPCNGMLLMMVKNLYLTQKQGLETEGSWREAVEKTAHEIANARAVTEAGIASIVTNFLNVHLNTSAVEEYLYECLLGYEDIEIKYAIVEFAITNWKEQDSERRQKEAILSAA